MRKGVAVMIAYVATAATVPWLFALAQAVVQLPLPRGLLFMPVLQTIVLASLLAAAAGLPGFLLARLVIGWLNLTSLLAYACGGALTGILAAGLLCLPNLLWVFGATALAPVALGVGLAAGVVQWLAERALIALGGRKAAAQRGGIA